MNNLHPETPKIDKDNLEGTLSRIDFFSAEAIKRALVLEVAANLRLDGGILANSAENLELSSPGWSIPLDVALESANGPPPDGGGAMSSSRQDREMAVIIAGEPLHHTPCSPNLRFLEMDDAMPWRPDPRLINNIEDQGGTLTGATASYYLHTSHDFQTKTHNPSHV